MPGMMDTVLNLGLNDVTVAALAEKSGDRRFAYDSYRRFITMYSDVVLGIRTITSRKSSTSTRIATAIRSIPISTADDWEEVVGASRSASRRRPAGRSRRTRTRNYGARSAPCSARG